MSSGGLDRGEVREDAGRPDRKVEARVGTPDGSRVGRDVERAEVGEGRVVSAAAAVVTGRERVSLLPSSERGPRDIKGDPPDDNLRVLVELVNDDGALDRRPLVAMLARLVIARNVLSELDARLLVRELKFDPDRARLVDQAVAASLNRRDLFRGEVPRQLDVVEFGILLQRPRERAGLVFVLEYRREELASTNEACQ